MIAVSTLLKSCAMPPASWPIACIFWLWTKFSCSVRCSVVSSAKTMRARALVALRIGGGEEQAGRTRGRSPSSATSIGAMSPLPCAGGRDRVRARRHGRARRPGRRSTAGPARPPSSAPAGARRAKAPLGRSTAPSASTEAIAIGVELKNAGETHFGGAQVLALSRPARG